MKKIKKPLSLVLAEISQKSKELSKSPNYDDVLEFIKNNPDKRIPGFPFSIAFPKMPQGDSYEIILVSGEKLIATVDGSREFASEGLEWKTKNGNKEQSVVAAWKYIE